jgi:hypothetical protein
MRARTWAIGLGILLLFGGWHLPARAVEPGPAKNSEYTFLRRLFLLTARLIGPIDQSVSCDEARRVKQETIAEINEIRREAREAAAKARNGIASDRAGVLAEYKAKSEEIQKRAKTAGPKITQLVEEWKAIDEKYRLGLLRKSDRGLLNEIDRNEHKVLEAADDAVRSVERWAGRCYNLGNIGIRG